MSITVAQINKPDWVNWLRAILLKEITGDCTDVSYNAGTALRVRADKNEIPADLLEMFSLINNLQLLRQVIHKFTIEQALTVWKKNVRDILTGTKLPEPVVDALLDYASKHKKEFTNSYTMGNLISRNDYEDLYRKYYKNFPQQILNSTRNSKTFYLTQKEMLDKKIKVDIYYSSTRIQGWLNDGALKFELTKEEVCDGD